MEYSGKMYNFTFSSYFLGITKNKNAINQRSDT